MSNKKYGYALTSGHFDPLHEGHLDCFKRIKEFSDYLIVLIDSDERTIEKKGYYNIPDKTRLAVIEAIKYVDYALVVDTPIADFIETTCMHIDCFCKGGDRTIETLPIREVEICKKLNIDIITGLGEKINSSSNMFKGIKENG